VVAVLRPGNPALSQVLLDSGCEVLECPDADLGMSASLRAGLLQSRQASAWLVALADMPYVQADTCASLLQALAAGADMVAPFYEGKRGNPVGFSAACLPELLALQGDQGARALLAQSRLQKLPVSDAGILRDIDTPADLSGA
jgi:molybdenum cofactor cytidylyltransferase